MGIKNKNNHILLEQIPSDSDPSISYNIGVDKKLSELYEHVHFTCSCTAFKFSGKGKMGEPGSWERHCKHSDEFLLKIFNLYKMSVMPFFHNPKNNRNETLNEILGYKLIPARVNSVSADGLPILRLREKLNTSFIQAIGIILTEIVCPHIMCSHVMKGEFSPHEFQTCGKCQKKFMPE
jgi:hypothetical protein